MKMYIEPNRDVPLPSIGRIVHYYPAGTPPATTPLVGIVTAADEMDVDLAVLFNESGLSILYSTRRVAYSPDGPGWRWPPRV